MEPTTGEAASAEIRSRRERELSRLALTKARWRRRLTGLDAGAATARAVAAK